MTATRVNYLNIGFMILSGVAAILLPFELILFSYTILGPLHYLTEISWLHKRQYFTPGKRDYLLLGLLALIISVPYVYHMGYQMAAEKDVEGKVIYTAGFITRFRHMMVFSQAMLFVAFVTAAIMLLMQNVYKRAIAIAAVVVLALVFRSADFIAILCAFFLPTLIHVFIFTGAFILLGALKGRSFSGMLSFIVFIACGVAIFFVNMPAINHSSSSFINSYDVSFYGLSKQIFALFLHRTPTRDDIYFSAAGIAITRFIAYAYTYHYLNWFSKTSVIRWHVIPRKTWIIIISIWLLSVALYFINYARGLAMLYFLSMLHVILEFPLNIQSFKGIGQELMPKRSNRAKRAA